MKIEKCRFCKTGDIYIHKHCGLWKVSCNEWYCLVVQCCDTKEQAIERWNEINTPTVTRDTSGEK